MYQFFSYENQPLREKEKEEARGHLVQTKEKERNQQREMDKKKEII